VFASQAQAKRFFVNRIISQALKEGNPLSKPEQRMLSWSESDPEFTPDPSLVDRLGEEISDEEYEMKVADLLERAYRDDLVLTLLAR
jgi:hypothetical protein